MIQIEEQSLHGFKDDFKRMARENSDYLLWWYTTKSIGLAVVAAAATYFWAKSRYCTRK